MGAERGLRRRVAGLSEAAFRERYGSEAQCRAALFQLRWGKGWACPGCGHGGYAELKGRAVYQCNRCKRQVGLTAGTVFHWTKLPLTTWFLAIYHLSQIVPRDAGLYSRPELVIKYGEPAKGIVDTAKACGADLIVLSVRDGDRFGVATHLPGTTAHQVVVNASCPVLTVRG